MVINKVSKCPLCCRKVSDILKHFAITYEITKMNQLKERLEQSGRKQSKQTEFNRYVDTLKELEVEGLIPAEGLQKVNHGMEKECN